MHGNMLIDAHRNHFFILTENYQVEYCSKIYEVFLQVYGQLLTGQLLIGQLLTKEETGADSCSPRTVAHPDICPPRLNITVLSVHGVTSTSTCIQLHIDFVYNL